MLVLADSAEETVGNYDAPLMIVPTLCVGMQPVTLCVTTVSGSAQVVRLERGASPEAFPRGAWERSGVESVGHHFTDISRQFTHAFFFGVPGAHEAFAREWLG